MTHLESKSYDHIHRFELDVIQPDQVVFSHCLPKKKLYTGKKQV